MTSVGAKALFAAWALVGIASCGRPEKEVQAPVAEYSPQTAILRIAARWQSQETEKGLLSPPSPIVSYTRQSSTVLNLESAQTTTEILLRVSEHFVLRTGEKVDCDTSLPVAGSLSFGRRAGQPALELGWAKASFARHCEPANSQIPEFQLSAGRSRFVLRSDQLVGVEPPREQRRFIPVD